MANAVWPISLPQDLLQGGYSEQQQDNRIVHQPDVGPSISRRRYTAVPTSLRGKQILSQAQKATLSTFYTSTLQGGALPFDWHLPGTSTACTMKFMAPPVYSVAGGAFYHVDLSLEILP